MTNTTTGGIAALNTARGSLTGTEAFAASSNSATIIRPAFR